MDAKNFKKNALKINRNCLHAKVVYIYTRRILLWCFMAVILYQGCCSRLISEELFYRGLLCVVAVLL